MMRSHGTSRFDSQSLAALSLGSLVAYRLANPESVCFALLAELALIQKTPHKLYSVLSFPDGR